jgi:twitching motility protein PilT
MINIVEILEFAAKNHASDIHIASKNTPYLRIQGILRKIETGPIPEDELTEALQKMMSEDQWAGFEKDWEADFAISVENLARFRVNVYRHMNGLSVAFRIIPYEIKSLEDLYMPEAVKGLINKRKGLILCTGPTGSGKSTTLASLLDRINREKKVHIITIEDPIEYLHSSKKSLIHQRELGSHTKTFGNALRNALREDPDVILVGEMRDYETISLALKAAETGHLVLSTLHTNNASETVDRIVDVFPSEQQMQVRVMLANTIQAVIGQRLVPMKNTTDRIAVIELMLGSSAIKNLIREGKSYQIDSVLQTSGGDGMQTFEKSLQGLISNNLVPAMSAGDVI